MNETHTTLDRLERRIEDEAARIDALYGLLELRGILPRGSDARRGDALFDDESEELDLSCRWQGRSRPTARPMARFHVGNATGV
jgi:hypothetical protein